MQTPFVSGLSDSQNKLVLRCFEAAALPLAVESECDTFGELSDLSRFILKLRLDQLTQAHMFLKDTKNVDPPEGLHTLLVSVITQRVEEVWGDLNCDYVMSDAVSDIINELHDDLSAILKRLTAGG